MNTNGYFKYTSTIYSFDKKYVNKNKCKKTLLEKYIRNNYVLIQFDQSHLDDINELYTILSEKKIMYFFNLNVLEYTKETIQNIVNKIDELKIKSGSIVLLKRINRSYKNDFICQRFKNITYIKGLSDEMIYISLADYIFIESFNGLNYKTTIDIALKEFQMMNSFKPITHEEENRVLLGKFHRHTLVTR